MTKSDVRGRKLLSERLYIEVFGRGHVEEADAILAPEVISHAPGVPPTVGSDGIKQQAVLLRTAIPDLRVELEDQLAEGDQVASRWRATGTHGGPLRLPTGDLPPSGRPIEFAEIRIDRFEGDRIVESWFIPDRLSFWMQLGLIPTQGR